MQAGFLFDLQTKDLIQLDFYATAGYYDPAQGTLYLVIDGVIYAFSEGDSNRTFYYLSKRYKFRYTSFGALKVISDAYPFTVDLNFSGTVNSMVVTSELPQRTPKTSLLNTCEIGIHGSSEVSVLYLSSILDELPV